MNYIRPIKRFILYSWIIYIKSLEKYNSKIKYIFIKAKVLDYYKE